MNFLRESFIWGCAVSFLVISGRADDQNTREVDAPGRLPWRFETNAGRVANNSLITLGTQTLTASDLISSSITGTNGNITVSPQSGLRFTPVTPCRVADTRNAAGPFGAPFIAGNVSRSFTIPNSPCGIPSTAQAYSLNVTVVPRGPLVYLTLWPTGQTQPFVSTLNSLDGRVKANAAIVPAGSGGAISVFATNETELILDIDGYFVPASNAVRSRFIPWRRAG
jgi:hypothetical protein